MISLMVLPSNHQLAPPSRNEEILFFLYMFKRKKIDLCLMIKLNKTSLENFLMLEKKKIFGFLAKGFFFKTFSNILV